MFEIAIVILVILWVISMFNKQKGRGSQKRRVEEMHHLGLIRERYDCQLEDSGFIYFVQESGNGRIKIGKAKDPEKRIQNDFGTIMPYHFDVIHLIQSKNYSKTENLFHRYFANKRFKGEWFDLSHADISWIKEGVFPRDIEDSIKGY